MSNTKVFAYVRVSSKEQNEARQLKEIKDLGINERDIFIDKKSGKDFNRLQYQSLKSCLRKGDLLYIKSIDRFGRNAKEIKREWEDITQNIKADIRVLDMPLLDTTQYKDMLGTFVSDLVLQVLAFVSERERMNILQRQAEGIAIAKASGKHLGRPKINLSVLNKEQRLILESKYKIWRDKETTGIEFMTSMGLKKNSFYKVIKEYEKMLQDS
ncbi:recombinase family protein [Planococcus halocryophilus]|uniref:recombinase family protein n=1 Tax=Planococcus halocryophilus TaxID=1215089 RepID=UPI001F116EF0|nr:recombinase family protein [Planococcus halocryophilus]MCH4825552.1 recombinase family protein [Planococcus halocryophilus]